MDTNLTVESAFEMIQKLKQENSSLKTSFVKEISALQMELAQISALKSIYEEKYNELKLKLAYSESSLNEKFQESLLIKSLNQKIQDNEKELKYLNDQKVILTDELSHFQEINSEFRRKLFKLEALVKDLKKENFILKAEKSNQGRIVSKSIEKKNDRKTPVLLTTSESQPRILDKTLIFNSTQSIRRDYSLTKPSSQYLPSFMRSNSKVKDKGIPDLALLRSSD
jgi:chromosome segregation ATPase